MNIGYTIFEAYVESSDGKAKVIERDMLSVKHSIEVNENTKFYLFNIVSIIINVCILFENNFCSYELMNPYFMLFFFAVF